jgi:hypothetical protein
VRKIEDILRFRADISPFLVHLTKNCGKTSASDVLDEIIGDQFLISTDASASDARFAVPLGEGTRIERARLFNAVSFSETPITEIHCLLEIAYRQINLQPYGLVFLKDRLKERGVSPVLYINNEQGDIDSVVRALAGLRKTNLAAAQQLLPLVCIFGTKLKPVGGTAVAGRVDFTWEREWRYPKANGRFRFDADDVFVGLCPHDEITYFQRLFRRVPFIDPCRNVKWYSEKLVQAQKRLKLNYSVV